MEPDPRYPTFEEVYPRHEFAPLVWLVLLAAAWIASRRVAKRAPVVS
jgi:hypothetical protein